MKKHSLIYIIYALLVLITFQACKEQEAEIRYFDLSGTWYVYNDSLSQSFTATVPGTIHTDLFQSGLIADPFKGTNEKNLQWIDKQNWDYSKEFLIDSTLINSAHIALVFEGLDTRADVYLNDSLILEANNMFRKWQAEVDGLIRRGKNKIEVHFHAADSRIQMHAQKYPVELPDERGFLRKAPYQFGWDWGPKFKGCGIWKPVYLMFWDKARMEQPQIIQRTLNDELAEIAVRCNLESSVSEDARLKLEVKGSKKLVFEKNIELNEGINSFEYLLKIDDPKRWWPNGMGNPYLYELKASLFLGDQLCDERSVNFGLRSIEVVNQKDSIGESFYFKVNGIPVFIKGANYIPQDNFLPRVSKDKYESLIKQAVDANMNMLRVWGGGIYEQDKFYEICDREGIMLWQDFMFACNMYPGDSAFLENVREEAEQNIVRLRNHPSLALWCGNNEVSEGWNNWGWQESMSYSAQDSIMLEKAYNAIFDSILPVVVETFDSGRFYWPSSPKYGWGREKSMTHGDSHYWGVWWGAEPFDVYERKTGRFMSEYGFQAFPSLACIDSFAAKEEQYLYSESMQVHQKHPRGFELIRTYMERGFPVPQKFEDYVYMSQLLQMHGIQKAIHAQRSSKPVCMGSLYWQLNDCWPVISWSSIDYFGNPKALYYGVKNAYENLLISVKTENNKAEIILVNDSLVALAGQLSVRLMDFYGKIIKDSLVSCRIRENSVDKPLQFKVTDWLGRRLPQEVFLSIRFIEGGKVLAGQNHFFVAPANLFLPEPGIDVQTKISKGGISVILSSGVLIKNILLEAENISGVFSDNYFDLLPGEKVSVLFRPNDHGFSGDLRIKIKSLNQFTSTQKTGI